MSEPLRAELRSAISSLFISGGAPSGDTALHASRLAAAAQSGNAALVKELASRDVRARLFLLAHASFSAAKASSAPDLVRDVAVLLRAVAARTRGALASLASDVGARPLVGVLMRASLRERGASPAGGAVDEAAVAAAELLVRLVAVHPRACAGLRLDAGVESVCSLLAPTPPADEALLHAAVRLLCALVDGSDAAARCAARRGVPAVALACLTARMGSAASVGPLLSLLGAVCAVAPVIAERPRSGAAAGAGGVPPAAAVIAAATRALTLHGVVDKEIAVGAMATIAGVVAGSDAEGAVAAGAAMAAAGTFTAIRDSLVAHAAPADLSRHVAAACARVTTALTLSREGRKLRPVLPSPMSVGYSATGLRMSVDGAPKVSSGHLSLVVSTLAPPHASGSPGDWPADSAPPVTIALWPLPAEYLGWSPSGLAPFVSALPSWAGAYLPRAGFFPYSVDVDDGGNATVRSCAGAPAEVGPPPPAAEIARAMTAWLHAPHWFPELQYAAALLPELSQPSHGASTARPSESQSAAARDYIESALVELASARRAPAACGSSCGGSARVPPAAMHPSSRIGPIGCGNAGAATALKDASAAKMRSLLSATGAFPFDAAHVSKNAAPSVPGAASPAMPALRSSLLLDHGGDFDDSSLAGVKFPRVHVSRDGLCSVRVFTLDGAATPTALHASTPVVALGAPLVAAITESASARLPALAPVLRASDEVASLCASPLADGYVVECGDFSDDANLIVTEAVEPALATSADIEKDVARRLLLTSAARNCQRAEAACAGVGQRSDAPALLYFRHALPEGAHKPNSLPPALCIGGGGAFLTASACEPACAAPIPVPRSFVGTAHPLAPPADLLRSSAHAREVASAAFALSVDAALRAPVSTVTPLTPRPLALLDDGPLSSSSAGNDEGAESGEEEVAEADAEAAKGAEDAAAHVDVTSSVAEAAAAGAAAVAAAWAAAANEAARKVPPLEFESRFESGNLCSAVRIGSTSYELALDPDVNTAGYSQWFFFRVRGMIPDATYTFSLINMGRDGSVFLGGQRPWVYVERGARDGGDDGARGAGVTVRGATLDAPPAVVPGDGWRRAGEELTYYRNAYERPRVRVSAPTWSTIGEDETDGACVSPASVDGSRFSHAWTIAFPVGTTAAWFAYAPPYTYSDLRRDIFRWESRAAALGRGEQVPIASPSGSDAEHAEASACAAAPLCETPGSSLRAESKERDTFSRLGYAAAGSAFESRGAAAASHLPSVAAGALFSSAALVRSTLCTSLAGNPVPLLTITDFSDGPAAVALRPFIVLSARVHPGETNASWMMRGLLDMLTSSAPVAVELRKRVVFKVVPMLNPDGVINGSHRTNLAGLDLNRVWAEPALSTAPTIWHLRALIMTIQARAAAAAARMAAGSDFDGSGETGAVAAPPRLPPVAAPVLMFCDFHGHSRRRNAFTFGCHDVAGPAGAPPVPGVLPPVPDADDANVSGRLFPKLLASRAETFAFSSCGWKVTRDKLSAARVSMWRDACLPLSYTLEAPFGSPSAGARAGVQVSTRSFADVGISFSLALLDLLEGPTGARAAAAVAALTAPRLFAKLPSPLRPRSNTAPPGASNVPGLGVDGASAETARGAASPPRASKPRRAAKPKPKEVEVIIFAGGGRKGPLTARGSSTNLSAIVEGGAK